MLKRTDAMMILRLHRQDPYQSDIATRVGCNVRTRRCSRRSCSVTLLRQLATASSIAALWLMGGR